MSYLTYNEYINLGFTEIEEQEFNRLIKKASSVLDSVTRFFYQTNDINNDIEFRASQFKKALAAQIEFFHEVGATTTEGINDPGSVSIGRTSISTGSKSSKQEGSKKSIISDDVYLFLQGTGLLYKGIGVRS